MLNTIAFYKGRANSRTYEKFRDKGDYDQIMIPSPVLGQG
jgi:hypothetical protein